jgi:hypothetical protein
MRNAKLKYQYRDPLTMKRIAALRTLPLQEQAEGTPLLQRLLVNLSPCFVCFALEV